MHSSAAQHRNAFIVVLVVLSLVAFLGMIRPYMLTLATAAVLSVLLHPVYLAMLRFVRGRRAVASATVLLLSLLVVWLPLIGLLSLIAVEAVRVGQSVLPWFEDQLRDPAGLFDSLPAWLPFPEQVEPYTARVIEQLGQSLGAIGRYVVQYMTKAGQGTVGLVIKGFVLLYAMFFFLIWGPAMFDSLLKNLPLSDEDRQHIINKGLSVTRATLKGILIIGVVQGLMVGIGFAAAGLDAAVFWGTLVVPISAMPLIGPPIIWGPAGIYLITQGAFVAGIGLLVWGAVAVGTIDNILRPRVVGSDTAMPDLMILISTLGGLGTFGPVGIILGPVLAGVLITVMDIYRRTPEFHTSETGTRETLTSLAPQPKLPGASEGAGGNDDSPGSGGA